MIEGCGKPLIASWRRTDPDGADSADAADAADALLALAKRGRAGEIYNIANGGYRPLRDYIEEARAVLAPQCDVAYGAADAGVFSLQPSVEKIQRDTGWMPVTDFVDGLRCGYGLLS